MDAFAVPVAFLVEGTDEAAAARTLADILARAHLTQDDRKRQRDLAREVFGASAKKDLGPIESWWIPNHRDADGGDDAEQVLVWRPGSEDPGEVPAILEAYATSIAYGIVRAALPSDLVYRHEDVAPVAASLEQDPAFRDLLARITARLVQDRLMDEEPAA